MAGRDYTHVPPPPPGKFKRSKEGPSVVPSAQQAAPEPAGDSRSQPAPAAPLRLFNASGQREPEPSTSRAAPEYAGNNGGGSPQPADLRRPFQERPSSRGSPSPEGGGGPDRRWQHQQQHQPGAFRGPGRGYGQGFGGGGRGPEGGTGGGGSGRAHQRAFHDGDWGGRGWGRGGGRHPGGGPRPQHLQHYQHHHHHQHRQQQQQQQQRQRQHIDPRTLGINVRYVGDVRPESALVVRSPDTLITFRPPRRPLSYSHISSLRYLLHAGDSPGHEPPLLQLTVLSSNYRQADRQAVPLHPLEAARTRLAAMLSHFRAQAGLKGKLVARFGKQLFYPTPSHRAAGAAQERFDFGASHTAAEVMSAIGRGISTTYDVHLPPAALQALKAALAGYMANHSAAQPAGQGEGGAQADARAEAEAEAGAPLQGQLLPQPTRAVVKYKVQLEIVDRPHAAGPEGGAEPPGGGGSGAAAAGSSYSGDGGHGGAMGRPGPGPPPGGGRRGDELVVNCTEDPERPGRLRIESVSRSARRQANIDICRPYCPVDMRIQGVVKGDLGPAPFDPDLVAFIGNMRLAGLRRRPDSAAAAAAGAATPPAAAAAAASGIASLGDFALPLGGAGRVGGPADAAPGSLGQEQRPIVHTKSTAFVSQASGACYRLRAFRRLRKVVWLVGGEDMWSSVEMTIQDYSDSGQGSSGAGGRDAGIATGPAAANGGGMTYEVRHMDLLEVQHLPLRQHLTRLALSSSSRGAGSDGGAEAAAGSAGGAPQEARVGGAAGGAAGKAEAAAAEARACEEDEQLLLSQFLSFIARCWHVSSIASPPARRRTRRSSSSGDSSTSDEAGLIR